MRHLMLLVAVLLLFASGGLVGACGVDAPVPPPAPDGGNVGPGASVSFAAVAAAALSCAPTSLTWSVLEPTGGVVTQTGSYTAPSCGPTYADGTYHVEAVGCGKSVSIPVMVNEIVTSITICGVAPGTTCCAPGPAVVPGGAVQFYATVGLSCHSVSQTGMPAPCP